MKFLVFLFCLCSASSYAMALGSFGCLADTGCNTTLIVNSGHSATTCADTGTCTCASLADGCPFRAVGYAVNCPSGYSAADGLANGGTCCINYRLCLDHPQTQHDDSVESALPADNSVEQIFDSNSRGTYWGVVDTTNKSPDTGRGNSAWAHLDACLGHAQVDTYTNMGSLADNSQCRTDCDSGIKNGVCNDTLTENNQSGQTNARCKDRCDCWMNATYGKTYNCEDL